MWLPTSVAFVLVYVDVHALPGTYTHQVVQFMAHSHADLPPERQGIQALEAN